MTQDFDDDEGKADDGEKKADDGKKMKADGESKADVESKATDPQKADSGERQEDLDHSEHGPAFRKSISKAAEEKRKIKKPRVQLPVTLTKELIEELVSEKR